MKNKFKCHPLIIFSGSARALKYILTFAAANLPIYIIVQKISGLGNTVLIFSIIAAVIALLIFYTIKFLAWKNTCYSICDKSICRTKKTFRLDEKMCAELSQISVICFKQGPVDIILNTVCVKINFNSSVISGGSGLYLIIKSTDAMLLAEIAGCCNTDFKRPVLTFKIGQIIIHTILSISVLKVIGFGALLAGAALPVISVSKALYPIVLIIGLPLTAVLSFFVKMVYNILRYYNMAVFKCENKIILSHGIFIKRVFVFTTNNINAVKLGQTFFSGIFGKYYAEFLCVGFGSHRKNSGSVVCVMTSKNNIIKFLKLYSNKIELPKTAMCFKTACLKNDYYLICSRFLKYTIVILPLKNVQKTTIYVTPLLKAFNFCIAGLNVTSKSKKYRLTAFLKLNILKQLLNKESYN